MLLLGGMESGIVDGVTEKNPWHDTEDVLEWEAGQWKQSQITVAPDDAFDV